MHEELRSFSSGSGGGGYGPLEERVNRLEGRIDKVSDDLGDVKINLATLTERVAHLPSKGFIVSTVVGGTGFFAALVLFADQIKALLGG